MRKPFTAGRFQLEAREKPWWWFVSTLRGDAWAVSDADLRHIARLCAKALKYRHQGKREAR